MSMISRAYLKITHAPADKTASADHIFNHALDMNAAALAYRNKVCGTVTSLFSQLTESLQEDKNGTKHR